MANRTERTTHTEVLLAQQHCAEHDDITRRLGEAEGKLQRLDAAVQDREAQLDDATSEWLKGIVREELEAYVVWAKQSQVTPTIVAHCRAWRPTFCSGQYDAIVVMKSG